MEAFVSKNWKTMIRPNALEVDVDSQKKTMESLLLSRLSVVTDLL